jgi:hypothetical protein
MLVLYLEPDETLKAVISERHRRGGRGFQIRLISSPQVHAHGISRTIQPRLRLLPTSRVVRPLTSVYRK